MNCSNCKNPIPDGVKFCPECGAKRPEENVCSNCGNTLISGKKFCPECGAKVYTEVKCTCGFSIPDGIKFCPECGAKRPEYSSSGVIANKPEPARINSVKIGGQIWMAENLNVDKFRNGDPVSEAKSEAEFKKFCNEGKPCWCYYDNKPENGNKYGKLYNWYAVSDHRGLSPEGWHIPDVNEWNEFVSFMGAEKDDSEFIINNIEKLAELKSETGWIENDNGNNISGFNAKPAGTISYDDGLFHGVGDSTAWWSSTMKYTDNPTICNLYSIMNVTFAESTIMQGLYVRCLKNI